MHIPENHSVEYIALPTKVKGFVIYDSIDDLYTIFINQNLSYYQNLETYFHELKHIIRSDFSISNPVDEIELECRKSNMSF